MSHSATPSQKLQDLQEAFELIIKKAAVQFPEGGSDLDKWDWTRILTLVLWEAAKRKDNLPVAKIVQCSEKVVRRQLEVEKAAALLKQEFAPLEEK
jgi:hypothetical protein